MTTPRVRAVRRHLRALGGLRASALPRREVQVETQAVRDAVLRVFRGMSPEERAETRALVAAAVAVAKAKDARR